MLAAIVRHGWERLVSGALKLSGPDWMRAMQLQIQAERAAEQRAPSPEVWEAAFRDFFDIARRFVPHDEQRAYHAACASSPAILAVSASAQAARRS